MSDNKDDIIKGLEDGSMLKEAINRFNSNRTVDNYMSICGLLSYSTIWVPYNAMLGKPDEESLAELVKEKGEDIVGAEWSNKQTIRLVPDILQSGDEYYFPVFSSEEEMGEYGMHFSVLPSKFIDAVILAKNNQTNISGIVVNAFTDPFVVNRELFSTFERIETKRNQ